jgi:hypothetical protein
MKQKPASGGFLVGELFLPLEEVAMADKEVAGYIAKMSPAQKAILKNPSSYTGIAAKRALEISAEWKNLIS